MTLASEDSEISFEFGEKKGLQVYDRYPYERKWVIPLHLNLVGKRD